MGKTPAVVIVVRHGARLDAADKQWHLTSPTPYDPPLTYGGWSQSRALGTRIANILRTRETDDDASTSPTNTPTRDGGDKRRRRHKVVIHTSPFLRCVQTSIAISAGLATNPGHSRPSRTLSVPHIRSPSDMHSSPRVRPVMDSPRLAPVAELSRSKSTDSIEPTIKKATLRVDAFLGEWLSPDYFEHITPPPGSSMMVTSAKGDLLRREDYNKLIHVRDITPAASSVTGFPGGWGSPVVAPAMDKSVDKSLEDSTPLSDLSSLSKALPVPRRDRTSSLSSAGSSGSGRSGKHVRIASAVTAEHGKYMAPTPSYAISTSDPIPSGYVAHARDQCTNIDFQWDSSKPPQNWGDGGEYGEEWSSMHKRFRKGLADLIQWYRDHDNGAKLSLMLEDEDAVEAAEDEDDDETDLVVVLVSHGAGCNALIGALTNQPVLLDVGMASLTMAVRKPELNKTPTTSPTATPRGHSRSSSKTVPVSEEYDVKLIANTEHMRQSSVSSVTRTPSIGGSIFKERYVPSGSDRGNGITVGEQTRGMSTAFGSIRRTASIASGPRNYSHPRTNSVGLWSAPVPVQDETPDEADDMVLNFGESNGAPDALTEEPSPTSSSRPSLEVKENNTVITPRLPEEDKVAPLGLWGAPRPPGEAERIREIAPKRRWTINERGVI